MSALETLMREHRTIEAVLGALRAFAEHHRPGDDADRGKLLRFVTFFAEYADAHHHGKEEEILFVEMTRHGFPREMGPIAVMLHEHDEGRALVARLRALGEQPTPWADADRSRLAAAARAFADLLGAHIHKEDQVLYPMAWSRLSPDVLAAIDEQVASFERSRQEDAARLVALAEELTGGGIGNGAGAGPEGGGSRE